MAGLPRVAGPGVFLFVLGVGVSRIHSFSVVGVENGNGNGIENENALC